MAGGVNISIVGIQALRDRLARLEKPGPFTKRLHSRLTVAWRDAADAFIRAAITRVLVDTGMSAATFFPLSRAIKRVGAKAAIRRHIGAGRVRKGSTTLNGRWNPLGVRSVAAGNRDGQQAFRFNVGSPARPVFRFSFQTVVYQFAFHEVNQRALDAGIEAFEPVARKRFIEEAEFVFSEWLKGKRLPGV